MNKWQEENAMPAVWAGRGVSTTGRDKRLQLSIHPSKSLRSPRKERMDD